MKVALVGAECEENLALRYIEGSLRENGHETVIIPFNDEDRTRDAAREMVESGAALAGFSMVFTYRAHEFARLAVEARRRGYAGHIVAGGHFAALNADRLLADVPAIDSVAVGEGERIICDLARRAADPTDVDGLVWSRREGQVVRNTAAVKPDNLDALAYPTRKRPPDHYLDLPIANMLSSRGCSHACSFCSIAAWHRACGGRRFRARTPASVAEEISQLYRWGYRIFNFHDDNFLPRDTKTAFDRVASLRRELEARDVGRVAFALKCRPDAVEASLFRLLKDMGLFRVFLGIEAGTPESLRRLGRKQSVSDNIEALGILNGLDIHTCFNLLIFNPDSTLDDVRGNVDFLRGHRENPVNFCRAEVYEGTPLKTYLERSGRLRGEYWGYGYEIADARAQLAFELMHRTMYERHHSAGNLHHLTMGMDYECHLADHFYRCSSGMKRKVKQFILKVNANTCDYLDELVARARIGFGSEGEREIFERGMKERLMHDGRALMAEGEDILVNVRQQVRRGAQSQKWIGRTAAAGLLAAVAAGAQVAQAVQPGEDDTVAPSEDQPEKEVKKDDGKNEDEGKGAQSGDGKQEGSEEKSGDAENGGEGKLLRPPEGKVDEIRNEFSSFVLVPLARQLPEVQDLQVEMWVGKDGSISYVEVVKPGVDLSKPAELSDAMKKEAEKQISRLGANGYREREKATSELEKMGRAIVPLIRKVADETKDPEVVARCKDIAENVEGKLLFEDRERIIGEMKRHVFSRDVQKNRSYIIAVKSQELERIKSRYEIRTHMCEMAPAPLD